MIKKIILWVIGIGIIFGIGSVILAPESSEETKKELTVKLEKERAEEKAKKEVKSLKEQFEKNLDI